MQLGIERKLNAEFPILNEWRFTHTYIIGKTRSGKSSFLKRSILDDIALNEGIAFFDPHGHDTEDLLQFIPPNRWQDVILFDPSDADFPLGFNPLNQIPEDQKSRVANAVLDTFKSIWKYDIPTPNIDLYVLTTTKALLDVPDGTLTGIAYMLTSSTYREKVISHIHDPALKAFWEDFYESIPDKEQRQSVMSTLNKIFALILDPTVRNIIGQVTSSFDLTHISDTGKILLVKLPQGKLGIEKSSLLGALLLSQLHLCLLNRSSPQPFHIYLDEAHRFGASTIEEMLSGIGKFNVSVTIAHQYLNQFPDSLRHAVIGTTGTLIAFRLGVIDAQLLEPEFRLTNNDHSLTQIAPYTTHVRTPDKTYPSLSQPPFSPTVYPKARETIRRLSRARYGRKKADVEARLNRFIQGT